MSTHSAPLVWVTHLPLFSRTMLLNWSGVMAATAAVMFLILGVIFAAQREWDALSSMSIMILAGSAGVWLLGLVVMAAVFCGRYEVRYTLSDQGILMETIDSVAKKASRLAIVAGILTRSPQLLGAGLISRAREAEEVRWSGAFKAVPDPARQSLALRNSWRTVMWVQCTAENYAAVCAAVDRHMQRRKTASRVPAGSPIPAYLGRTLLVLLACVPLFLLAEEYRTGLFLPILVLCFALATVWLINLFGWVVLGGLGLQAALVILAQFEQRKSMFQPGTYYRAYEVLSGEDFGIFLLAGIGAAILTWICMGALRGHWLAALVADHSDMGEG